jgi:hypothetical protein
MEQKTKKRSKIFKKYFKTIQNHSPRPLFTAIQPTPHPTNRAEKRSPHTIGHGESDGDNPRA